MENIIDMIQLQNNKLANNNKNKKVRYLNFLSYRKPVI